MKLHYAQTKQLALINLKQAEWKVSRKEPSHTKTSWKSALSLSDIPCSRRQTILTIDKFCFNYLLWLNVSYFGEKLENVSFIFTKQPTRARFLLKNAQAHVVFQTESLAWTDAKLNFARCRQDEIRQILDIFYNFFNRLWHQFAVMDRSIVHVL